MTNTGRSRAFGLLALAGTLVAGCAVGSTVTAADAADPSQEAAMAEDGSADQAPTPEAEAREIPVPEAELAEGMVGHQGPADGEWKVDDRGREYYEVEVVRKPEYSLTAEGRVMLPPGVAYDLAEVRDDTVVVKVYNPESLPLNEALRIQSRKEVVDELFELDLEEVDRLRFDRISSGLPDRGQWRQGFDIADMNGDGNLDIVHGPARKGDGVPRIFLGDGKGGWRVWQEVTFEGRPLDYGDVAVADYNGDGELDIAFAVHLRGLLVMVGDGRGAFREWSEGLPYWTPSGGQTVPAFSSRAVVAVDWNRDGKPDLLALGEGPRVVREQGAVAPSVNRGERGPVLFLNKGDGQWERYDQGTGRKKIFGDALAAGDFDGDGLTDFIVASRVPGATQLVKMGREDGSWEDVSLRGQVRRAVYSAVHAADVDDDGRDELFVGYAMVGSDGARWAGIDFLELEDGSWHRTPVVTKQVDVSGVTAIAVGDLDGDDREDVVALTGDGQRWVFLGGPDHTFVQERAGELAPTDRGCQGYHAQFVPVDDGKRNLLLMEFAGESGSEQLIPGLERRCQRKGSIEAWTYGAHR